MWGSSGIWFCLSSGNPWHMDETCRYFPKVWLLPVPLFYCLSAIPSVKSVHPLYFSSIFSFSSTVMLTVLLWNLSFFFFFFKEDIWRSLVVRFQVYWLNLSFVYVQNTFTFVFKFHLLAWNFLGKENSREASFKMIAQLLAFNSNHGLLWCIFNIPMTIFSFLIQSLWDDISDFLAVKICILWFISPPWILRLNFICAVYLNSGFPCEIL